MKEVRQKTTAKMPKRAVNEAGREGELISLHHLNPEEALTGILQVPRESKDKQDWNKVISRRKKR